MPLEGPDHDVQSPSVASLRLAARLVAVVAVGCLASCGIASVGAIFGSTSSGGGGSDAAEADRFALLARESTPVLLDFAPPDPSEDPLGYDQFAANNPQLVSPVTDLLRVRFNERVRSESLDPPSVTLRVLRPGEGTLLPVAVESVEVSGTSPEEVAVALEESLTRGAVYELQLGSVGSADSGDRLDLPPLWFVTARPSWREVELLAYGSGAGATTLADGLQKYSTGQSFSDLPGSRLIATSVFAGQFDGPWQGAVSPFARLVRISNDPGEGVQLQTSAVFASNLTGGYRISEGDPNEQSAENFFQVLRIPLAVQDPQSRLLVFDQPPLVLNTRPSSLSDENALIARVDLPGPLTPELETAHFSFNGAVATAGDEVGVTFWGISEPTDVGFGADRLRFDTQRVYANHVTVAAPGHPWGEATLLSAPSTDHASWPFLVDEPQGRAHAVWFSSDDSTAGLFDETVDRYWMSEWTPGIGWRAAVDITPPGEVGSVDPVTDVEFVDIGTDGAPRRELVVFGRRSLMGGGSRPVARRYDLDTGTWTKSTSPMSSSGVTLDDVVKVPTFDQYNLTTGQVSGGVSDVLRYGHLRAEIRRATPRSETIGFGSFFVQWIDEATTGEFRLILATYDAEDDSWSEPVTLDPDRVTVSATDPSDLSALFAFDLHGRATLFWLEEGTTPLAGSVRAQTIHLGIDGIESFNDVGYPSVDLSGPVARFPTVSNVHASGGMVVTFPFGLIDPSSNQFVFLGTNATRFE